MSEPVYRSAVTGLGVMGQIAGGLGGKHPVWYPPCCHADAYVMHPKTELVVGATRDPGRQNRFRDVHNKPVYTSYHKMLEKEKPDIVSIATSATVHAEMAIAAAKSGAKAIWCEKAMAVSLAQCDEMVDVENGGPPKSSGEDGRVAFEMIKAIHQSHHKQKQGIDFPLNLRGYEIPSS